MSTEHDDLLSRAARSLQEETEGPSSAARFTRLRVMASLRETQVKRRTQTLAATGLRPKPLATGGNTPT